MDTGFQYPAGYSLPAAKKIKLENGVDLLQQHPELAYPNTDAQYTNTILPNNMTQEEYIKAWNDYYASIGQVNPLSQNISTTTTTPTTTLSTSITTESESSNTKNNEESNNKLSKDWIEVLDDETGATYYYNSSTGESSWGIPPNEDQHQENDKNDKNDENESKTNEEVEKIE